MTQIIAHRTGPMEYYLDSGVRVYPDAETGLWQYANGVFVCEDIIVIDDVPQDHFVDANKMVPCHITEAGKMVPVVIDEDEFLSCRDPRDMRCW